YEITGNGRLKNWKNDIELSRTYKMYLENIIEIRHEHQRSIRVDGGYSDEILGIRLYLYIDLYMKLQRGIEVEVPSREAREKLFNEIKIISDTIIGERFRNYCVSSEIKEALIGNRAKAIVKKLVELKVGEEFVIRSGYEGNPGHSLYVSLVKMSNDNVIARVDNRWIKEGRVDGEVHKHYTKQEGELRKIKSCYIGAFRLGRDEEPLTQYIVDAIQSMFLRSSQTEKGLSNIYGVNLPGRIKNISGEVTSYIESWPYHTIQSHDNGNCILSSYNLGMLVRHGEEFFEWLLNYETRETAAGNQRSAGNNPNADNMRREGGNRRAAGGGGLGWTDRVGEKSETEGITQSSLSHTEL
ncbi:hypothetical protein NF27_AQ00010, partial [Candidatus Jidaibacter acanthamoeba]